jgi:hypothetical protein
MMRAKRRALIIKAIEFCIYFLVLLAICFAACHIMGLGLQLMGVN